MICSQSQNANKGIRLCGSIMAKGKGALYETDHFELFICIYPPSFGWMSCAPSMLQVVERVAHYCCGSGTCTDCIHCRSDCSQSWQRTVRPSLCTGCLPTDRLPPGGFDYKTPCARSTPQKGVALASHEVSCASGPSRPMRLDFIAVCKKPCFRDGRSRKQGFCSFPAARTQSAAASRARRPLYRRVCLLLCTICSTA